MTSPSDSHPGGAAAGSGGMLTAEPFGRYGRREGTTRRKSQVVDRSGTATELARVRARLAELDAEQRRLLQELSALEARETAEIAALPTLLTIIVSAVPIMEFNNCSNTTGTSASSTRLLRVNRSPGNRAAAWATAGCRRRSTPSSSSPAPHNSGTELIAHSAPAPQA